MVNSSIRELLALTPHLKQGTLIVICGIDGSGKTTHCNLLGEHLESRGASVLVTKQPTEFGRSLPIFLKYNFTRSGRNNIDYRAYLCLMLGDRLEHISNTFLPALVKGQTVISDRYVYTLVALMRARGHKEEAWVYQVASHIPRPDVTFLLDLPVECAIERIKTRTLEKDSFFIREELARTRVEFRNMAKLLGFKVIDTSKLSCEATQAKIQAHLEGHLMESRGRAT